jgi:thiol-disulfide isomerase/thioredoxin
MKQNLLVLLIAILALAGGIAVKQIFSDQKETTILQTSGLNFKLPDSNGIMRHSDEWQGKILIINFWATWCPPCLKEIPAFVKLQQEYAEQEIQFIGIAVEEKEPVINFLQHQAVNYPILIGGDHGISLAQQLGNFANAVPFTLIVNQQGQIIHRQAGELSTEQLTEMLQKLLTFS